MISWGFMLLAYFSGSVPFGLLLTRRFRGVDVRAQGSGNIGATNVARVAGKKLAVCVLLLDAAKGALPVLLAILVAPDRPRLHAATALAAFLGHVFPIWLRWKGGKGVATGLGVLVVLVPLAAVLGVAVYAVVFLVSRISSVGSLCAALATVAGTFLFARHPEYPLLGLVLMAMLLITHRENLRRLLRRTERAL